MGANEFLQQTQVVEDLAELDRFLEEDTGDDTWDDWDLWANEINDLDDLDRYD